MLNDNIRQFQYQNVSMILLVIVVLVMFIDYLSGELRKRVDRGLYAAMGIVNHQDTNAPGHTGNSREIDSQLQTPDSRLPDGIIFQLYPPMHRLYV